MECRGANVHAVDNNGRTALHHAILNGFQDGVCLLLDREANIERVDQNNWTALLWAASRSYIGMINALLNRGACVHSANNK